MDKLASLVPEVYYDLIGRVVPGSLLYLALAHTKLPSLDREPTIALVLLVGYAMGLVLDTLAGTLLDWPNRYIFQVFGQLAKKKQGVWQVHVWQMIAREPNEARASHLRKMMAERAMLRNLMVLSIALWLFGGWPMSELSALVKTAAVIAFVVVYYRMEFWVRNEAVNRSDPSRAA